MEPVPAAFGTPALVDMIDTAPAAVDDTVARSRAAMIAAGAVQLLSLADFAALYGVSTRTAWRLIADGQIDARKAGSKTLINFASAKAWADGLPRVTRAS